MPALPDLNLAPPSSLPELPSHAPRAPSRQPITPLTTGSSFPSSSPSTSRSRPPPQAGEELQAAARRLRFSQSATWQSLLSRGHGRAPHRPPDSRKSQRQPAPRQTAGSPAPAHAPPPGTQPPSRPAPSVIRSVSDERQARGRAPVVQPAPAVAAAARELELLRYASEAALQQQVWAAEAARPQLRLYTVEGNSAGYKTKWEELHQASQGLLLQIEDKMREYMYDSKQFEQLDTCSHLYDSSASSMSFELNASHITQDIRLIASIMDREKASIESLMAVVKEIMQNAEFVVCSYVRLRPRFVNRGAGIANVGFADLAGSSGARTDFNQPLTMAPTFHFYSGFAMRPSFMRQTVAQFEKQLGECCKLIGELEQLVRMKNDKTYPDSLGSLSKVISNVHDYFIHVASKVENLHQLVETMRIQHLHDRRRRGDRSNPFLEAGRREATKQEAATRRVHPTLHLPLQIQQMAPVAAPAIASQPQQPLVPTAATLSTPLSAVQTFSIRTTARLPNPFTSTEFMLQPTPCGSTSTLTAGPTPSLCGRSTPSSAALSTSGGTFTFPITRLTGGRLPQRRH